MAKREYDFRNVEPAKAGQRRDYISPGPYRFKVVAYDDKPAGNGKAMDTFTYEVVSKGTQLGKRLTDRFTIPTGRENKYPLQRLLAFLEACGVNATGKKAGMDPKRLLNREFNATVYDQVEAERKVGTTTYPSRTVSAIEYAEDEEADDDDDEDEDEDDDLDEDEDDDEEDEDEDEDEEDDEEDDEDEDDEDDEDEDEDDDEDEEEEPAPRRRATSRGSSKATASSRTSSKSSSKVAAKPAAKTRAKAAPVKAVKGKSKSAAKPAKKARGEPDFPFED